MKLAQRDRTRVESREGITAETRIAELAEAWFCGLELAPTTMQAYRDRLDGLVLPSLGQLRVRELTVGTLDRYLRLIAHRNGPATAKMTRSVLRNVRAGRPPRRPGTQPRS